MGDSAAGGDFPAFVPNEDLEEAAAAERVRAPADDRPYAEDEEDDSFCFLSKYAPGEDDDPTNLGNDELKEAFRQLNAIIDNNYGKNTSLPDLVDAVYEFYEHSIRSRFDYGEWKRSSIYRFIFNYSAGAEDRQASEGIKLIWSNIELLREHVALRDPATGKVTPDLRIMKSLQDSLKLHAALVDARRKRPKASS